MKKRRIRSVSFFFLSPLGLQKTRKFIDKSVFLLKTDEFFSLSQPRVAKNFKSYLLAIIFCGNIIYIGKYDLFDFDAILPKKYLIGETYDDR